MTEAPNTEVEAAGSILKPVPDQGEGIAFLSDGRAFALPGQPVERIDTHAAFVAPTAILERRLALRRGDASDADLDVLARQLGGVGTMSWAVFDASGEADRIAAQIHERIAVHDEQVVRSDR